MILYLSSIQHVNLLDFIGFCDADSEKTIKKMVGNFVLKQFVIYDMRNFSHFTDIVLDRPAFGDTNEEFVQAIEEFLMMYQIRVTVICEGISQNDPFFQSLLDKGVGNIVSDTNIFAMQSEIRECLSDTGMVRYHPKRQQKKRENQEKYQFECKNVVIAVAGSQPRAGTTTAAVGLCAWLARVGADVCYVEANKSGHLAAIARSYGMEQQDKGWFFEGVHYLIGAEKPNGRMNFVVYDMGCDFIQQRVLLDGADLKYLICGTKPYELSFTIRLQAMLSGAYAYVACPFVADGMKEDLTAALQNKYHKILFTEYQPEPTSSDCNSELYKIIIGKYIAGA